MSRAPSSEESRRGGPVGLDVALRGFLRSSGLGERLRHARVYRAWNDALGPELSQRARPVQFRFGELTVEVESAAHHQELQNFTGEQYRCEANRLLGESRIDKVLFRLKR